MKTFLKNKTLGLFVKTKGQISKLLLGGIGHVLMLHRVLPEKLRNNYTFNKGLAISTEFLEEKIKILKSRGYNFISMDELYNILINKQKPKNKFVIFTMDDGYRDNLEYAYPLFKKYNIPFLIYVTNSFPDHTAKLWWYWLEEKVNNNDKILFRNEIYPCTSQNDKMTVYKVLREKIKDAAPSEMHHITRHFFGKTEQAISEEMKAISLSWDEIKQIHQSEPGCIGGHTQNHISLSAATDEELITEIHDSKLAAEKHIGSKLMHFAYPYGGIADAGKREAEAVQNTGYKTAVMNHPGNVFKQTKNKLFMIPRYPLGNNTTEEQFNHFFNGIRHFSANGIAKTIQ